MVRVKRSDNKLNKLQVHLVAAVEHVKEKSVKLSKFEKMMFSSFAIFIFVVLMGLMVSGLINAAYPYAPSGGIVTTSAGNVPENGVVAFNRADCPPGWQLADGTGGTPDLRGIFIRGAGVSGVLQMANGTNFSSTYGVYNNDSIQAHNHTIRYAVDNLDNSGSSNRDDFGNSGGASTREGSVLGASNANAGEPRTGAETAPASYSMIYCIKTATDAPTSNSIWNVLSDGVTTLVNSSSDFAINTSNLYVDASTGRVGIGTDSPVAKLQLVGDAAYSNGGHVLINSSDYRLIQLGSRGDSGAGLDKAAITMYSEGTSKVYLDAGGSSYFTGGNVGIGVSDPQTLLDLGIAGALKLPQNYASSPTCDANTVGSLNYYYSDGCIASLQICYKDSSSTYGWGTVWTSGLGAGC